MRHRWLVPFAMLVMVAGLSPPALASQRVLRACDNNEDYPPFRWRSVAPDGSPVIHGIGHAVLRQILARNGWRVEIDLLPLRRCLQEVAAGKNYHLVISSSPSPERQRTYLLTEPFDHVHFHSFYLQRRYPQVAPVRLREDLQQQRLCGLAGHNFSMFGVDKSQYVAEAEDFPAVFQMLRSQRCDVLPYNIEAIEGFRMLGQDFLAGGEIAHTAITDMAPAPILMAISRAWRDGEAMQALINGELAAMRASGELQELKTRVLNGEAITPFQTSPQ